MAKPSVTNIRPPVEPGGIAEFDLNDLDHDEFFALNGSDEFDALLARLNLSGHGVTLEDLQEYDYAFFGSNGSDSVRAATDDTGIIATGNGSDEVHGDNADNVIFAGNGRDTVRGGTGNDIITGENGTDKLCGNEGDDKICGGNGKDTLHGGDGDDTLRGGNGGDQLVGGAGADKLIGELGGDEFQWNLITDFGDEVTDFTAGSDKLVFDVEAADDETDELEISIGNDDEVVDNFVSGDDDDINVADVEVAVKTDADVATGDIQVTIDGYDNITTGALFVFLDEDLGHAVIYYDGDPSDTADDDAALVAELTNITTLEQLEALQASDFIFV
jgi:Ca2+-binding RTX toxin-like protein